MNHNRAFARSKGTLVIPAYNEGRRLPPFLRDLCAALSKQPGLSVLIVDDGSRSSERHRVQEAIRTVGREFPSVPVKMLTQPRNLGKGAALAVGFEMATTPIVGFVDADGSIGAVEVVRLFRELCGTSEKGKITAVLGSRVRLLGKTVRRNFLRHLIGRTFATFLAWLFDFPIYDSQCGCKFFVRDEALPLIPHIRSRRWLWDTELIILMHKTGRAMIEVPVAWVDKTGSKVSLVRDPFRMLKELLEFKRRLPRLALPTRKKPIRTRRESSAA